MKTIKNEKIKKVYFENDGFNIVATTNYKMKINGNINIGDVIDVLEFTEEKNKYGLTINVKNYEKTDTDTNEFIKYLFATKVKRVGKVTVQKLIDKYGSDLLKEIRTNKEEVSKISRSLTIEKLEAIDKALNCSQMVDKLMMILSVHKIGIKQVQAVVEAGIDAQQVARDAFCLYPTITDLRRLEAIAENFGQSKQNSKRIQAYILNLMHVHSQSGNLYVDNSVFWEELTIKEVNNESIIAELEQLINKKTIVREEDRLYLSYNNYLENSIVKKIEEIKDQTSVYPINFNKVDKTTLSSEQIEALNAVMYRFSILTGGAGVGKTMVINKIYELLTRNGKSVALLAPTGKASARMSEVTGVETYTMHRKLNIIPLADSELEEIIEDYVIVDESSMVDADLFWKFISNIADHTSILMVGDKNQLSPVGVGSIFKDLIESGVCNVYELTKVFRQGANSSVYINSQKIINGETDFIFDEYFKFIEENDDEVVEYVKNNYSSNKIVLTPKNVGLTGTKNLNNTIQEVVNARSFGKGETEIENTKFRVGDKVMQTKNNYDLDVFNGLVGEITMIDGWEITVEFENDHVATYDTTNRGELVLAYALTIHKSQGSEYKEAIIVLSNNSSFMNTKQLVYTAITRAKEKVTIIGNKQQLIECVLKNEVEERNSYIVQKLSTPY